MNCRIVLALISAAALWVTSGAATAAPPISVQPSRDTDDYVSLNGCNYTVSGFSCVLFSVQDAFSSAGVYQYSRIDFLQIDTDSGTSRTFNCFSSLPSGAALKNSSTQSVSVVVAVNLDGLGCSYSGYSPGAIVQMSWSASGFLTTGSLNTSGSENNGPGSTSKTFTCRAVYGDAAQQVAGTVDGVAIPSQVAGGSFRRQTCNSVSKTF